MKIDMNRLKNYLSDLDPDTSIVDEAIATIEAVAENKTDDELYERERPLMIAYLALRIAKAGLNVSPQNNENECKQIDIKEAVEQLYNYCETHYQCHGCIFRDGNGCMLSYEPYTWKIDEKKSEETDNA